MLVCSELVLYSAARMKRWYQTQASKKWSSCHSIYILVKQGNSQPIKGTRKRDKELIAVDLNTAHASAGHCKVKCRFMLLIALALGISGDVGVGFFFLVLSHVQPTVCLCCAQESRKLITLFSSHGKLRIILAGMSTPLVIGFSNAFSTLLLLLITNTNGTLCNPMAVHLYISVFLHCFSFLSRQGVATSPEHYPCLS